MVIKVQYIEECEELAHGIVCQGLHTMHCEDYLY